MQCLIRNFMCCHVSSRDRTEQPELSSSGHGIKEHRDQSLLFFPQISIIIICILCIFIPFLHADTTWVAGDVFGVWDTTGSPFMVIDTITVPLDSTLRIRPGVEIWFLDQAINHPALIVHGQLLAVGEEGDSIYFTSNEVGPARIDNDNVTGSVIRMKYCVVDSNIRGIKSHGGFMTLLHSSIFAYGDPIWNSEQVDTIQYCYIHEGWIRLIYGSIVFQHNRGDFATLTISGEQMAPIFDNQIFRFNITGGNATEIYDNELVDALCFYNNSHWYNNNFEGGLGIQGGTTFVEHNVMGEGGFGLRECQGVVRENEMGGVLLEDSYVTFQKNLVVSDHYGIWINGDGVNRILGNTIVFDDEGIDCSAFGDSTYVYDNIFIGDGVNSTGIYGSSSRSFDIKYNDFHQVNSVTYNCELDTGNIFVDPLLRGGYPFDYHLQANSPCIDAGDPTSPLDPDSTRADMGVYYYDQLIDQPPALVSTFIVNVQRGTKLRYTAQATDDNGPLRFGFWGLPRWLYRVYPVLDFVENSAYLSGRVPNNQEDFTFGVWVEDGLAQRDSQEVSVLISPYTILEGEVTGVLTLEQSPYMVVEDVVVPAGDSLRIEPGVEIRFQWHPVEDFRHRILVRGILNAIGTPEDTIHFIPEFGDSLLRAWRGIWCVGASEDTSIIEFAYLLNAKHAAVADSHASLIVKHTKIVDSRFGVFVDNNSWALVDSCESLIYTNRSNVFVMVTSSSAIIKNSYSEYFNPNSTNSHFDFQDSSRGIVQGCTFVGAWGGRAEYGSWMEFIGNRVKYAYAGIGYANWASGICANNIFANSGGVFIFSGDTILVSNNLFYHTDVGIDISNPPDEVFIRNNIFLENQYGVLVRNGISTALELDYNDFFANDSDLVNCLGDSANIFLNPIVEDTVDFRLQLGSPCIDAGDPDLFFNDPDSTRNDIGCWGGPWGESYQYPMLLANLIKPVPLEFALLPPYPNPFNSVLVIPFTIPTQSEVMITIYNILGQRIDQFDFFPVSPGAHRTLWDASDMSSGIYFVRMETETGIQSAKMLLLK